MSKKFSILSICLVVLSCLGQIAVAESKTSKYARASSSSEHYCEVWDRVRSIKGKIASIKIYYFKKNGECKAKDAPVELHCEPLHVHILDHGSSLNGISVGTLGGRRITGVTYGGQDAELNDLVDQLSGWDNATCMATPK